MHVSILCQKVEVGTTEGGANAYRGGTGVVSVYGLRLTKHQISSANILLTNGPPEQRNVIMAGWMVAPSIYGDSATRLFTYWTQDTGRNTGCYNLLCQGFVIAGSEVAPGSLLSPVSTYNGTTYDLKIRIFQDPNSQNWVLTVFEDDIVVGYWPKELVPHLLNGAGYVGWGGLAKEGKDGTSPPMGSGHKPDGNFNIATYFKHIRCYTVDLSEIQLSYGSSKEIVDDTGCYGLQNDSRQSPDVRDHFLFGGPGGKCGA
ncbi:hypothetical protein EZV62_018915 [Acer yangbiense]|uniref:Neprosin PEP catalytic domain-containing protein n=1 Tax=Acer yangbiense TaxID=1000413 RepID=A0A5C7HA57_9ROSI|nr:hypothetical protein EZV62_018915 [Acer yangbiense]